MDNFDLRTYLDLHGSQTRSVFGAWNTGLGHGDFLYLDYILYDNNQLSSAVELGTMHGLTTLYIAVAMLLRSGSTFSYDIKSLVPDHIGEVAERLNIHFLQGDILDDPKMIEMVRVMIHNPYTLLFCDNGNKEREMKLYAPYLEPGSVMLVHDCWTEVSPDRIVPFIENYEPLRHDMAEAMNSHLRAWLKVR